MKRLAIAIVLLIPSSAFAQQQQSTALDRLSLAYGQCVGGLEQRVDEITSLRKQIEVAQATIKALQEKPAPTEPPKE